MMSSMRDPSADQGLLAEVIGEVQWLVEHHTGHLAGASDPGLVTVTELAMALFDTPVPRPAFVRMLAREARLNRLPVDPEVLGERLWTIGSSRRDAA